MSAVAVGPSRLTLDPGIDGSGWDVTVIEQPGGVAEVARVGGAIVVHVGDFDVAPLAARAHAAGNHAACCTTVTLEPGGRVVVQASAAPPALLVSSSSAVLVPSTPGERGVARLDADERLLVLSAEAYDTLPPALVTLLRELPLRVPGADPAVLLETLFEQIPAGCGALIAVAQR